MSFRRLRDIIYALLIPSQPAEMTFEVLKVDTEPFEGQEPGTSGLRKRVKVFQQKNYTENFVQCIFNAMDKGAKDATLIVGGDGRYFSKEAINIIVRIAAANGVAKLIIGQNGILSTPAGSHLVQKMKTDGAILLTASHNPGGPEYDFGIKFNTSSGGPAPEKITRKIYQESLKIKEYAIADSVVLDISKIGASKFGDMIIEVIDPVNDYVEMMKEIFDFDLIRKFVKDNPKFSFLFDALNGVTGPYAKRIFEDELGIEECTQNAIPLADFGGLHPDPNLIHAKSLIDEVDKRHITLGAASDGDGDRNMIYGAGAFINPNDSVAVIAHHHKLILRFQNGLKGVARSLPTSPALDKVAEAIGKPCYVTPTGWKYFCNLYDADMISISGEESFGTSGDHIREKDGIWAVLAWLNIYAALNLKDESFNSLRAIMLDFWKKYGKVYFSRYDYEELPSDKARLIVKAFSEIATSAGAKDMELHGLKVEDGGSFTYSDPVDHSKSENQGLFLNFTGGRRMVVRLSGTGTVGATLRLYLSESETDSAKFDEDPQEYLKPFFSVAREILRIESFTGRKEPSIIT